MAVRVRRNVLSKWSSSLVVVLVAGLVGLAIVWPAGLQAVLRIFGWSLAGVVGTLVVIQLLVVPLTEAVPAMIATNKLVAATANSPSELLPLYLNSSKDLLLSMVANNFLLLVATIVAVLSTGKAARRFALVFVALALAVSVWRAIATGQFVGGTQNLTVFSVPITLFLVVPLLVAVTIIASLRLPALESDEDESQAAEPPKQPADVPVDRSLWPRG